MADLKLNPAKAALGQMLKLVEDGILVRNIKDDGNVTVYVEQSVRLTRVLKQAQDALAPKQHSAQTHAGRITQAAEHSGVFDDGTRRTERKPALDE